MGLSRHQAKVGKVTQAVCQRQYLGGDTAARALWPESPFGALARAVDLDDGAVDCPPGE